MKKQINSKKSVDYSSNGKSKKSFPIVFLILLALTFQIQSATLEVAPVVATQQSKVTISASGLINISSYEVQLTNNFSNQSLGTFRSSTDGRIRVEVTIPSQITGDASIQLIRSGRVVKSTSISIAQNINLTINDSRFYPGEKVGITAQGLYSGAKISLRLDGNRIFGPKEVTTEQQDISFIMPQSASNLTENIPLTLEQSFDGQALGEANGTITRLSRNRLEFGTPVSQDFPNIIQNGVPFNFSGNIPTPDGLDASSLNWKYSAVVNGNCLPVTSAQMQVQSNGDFTVNNAYFNELVDGYGPNELSKPVDQDGFVYENPQTGESGCLPRGSLSLDEQQNVTIAILVQDKNGNAISDAAVSFRGVDKNIFSNQNPSKSFNINGNILNDFDLSESHLLGNNQFTEVAETLGQGTCPESESLMFTNADGIATQNLNYFEYIVKKASQAALNVADANTYGVEPTALKFSVNVSAISQGFGYVSDKNCSTGVRFDLELRDDAKIYLRNDVDGEFTIEHDTISGPLIVTLPNLPANNKVCFQGLPYITGLPSETIPSTSGVINGPYGAMPIYRFEFVKLGPLITFPHASTNMFQNVSDLEIFLDYNQALFGTLKNVTLNLGGFTFPMTYDASGGQCDVSGGAYKAVIPNGHLLGEGVISGSISGELSSSDTLVTSDFKLMVEQGPQWFNDSSQYESVSINWKPDRSSIRATEVMQMQIADTSPTSNSKLSEYGIEGGMNNDQGSQATVSQYINGGLVDNRTRRASSPGTVNNRNSDPEPVDQDITGEGGNANSIQNKSSSCTHSDESKTPFPRPNVLTTIGGCEEETIFETGKIPLFRYAWGAPPIAAATLGADLWFGVYFRYFGDVVASLKEISINFTAEPIVRAGVDIFFDLSALFGIVSARVDASPVIGVGMPISVIESQSASIQACFNFDLILSYIASVGLCPVCLKVEDSEELFKISEPSGCIVPSLVQKKGLNTDINMNFPAIAVSQFGTTWVAYESNGKISVEKRILSTPVASYTLPDAPVMQPKLAMFNTDTPVVIWSQSSLSEQEFLDLNFGLERTGLTPAVNSLHLVYSVFDVNNDAFGPVMNLTVPTGGGDGAVSLAVCPNTDPNCPAEGRILALWEHDRGSDLSLHDLEVRWSEFNGTSWTAPAAIDPGNTFKQVQPNAVYHLGHPMAVWIENPEAGPGVYDMNARHLRYRMIGVGSAMDADGIPNSIASPDALSQADGDKMLVTYTISDDETRFIGSRRKLHTAWGDCDELTGVCDWTDEERLDSLGRSIYVEHPKLVKDNTGRVTAIFRYLSNSDVKESDPIGVIAGSGDVARLELMAPTLTDPVALTNDGRVNWGVQSVVNPWTGDINTIYAKGNELSALTKKAIGSKAKAKTSKVSSLNPSTNIYFSVDSNLPDFKVKSMTASNNNLTIGEMVNVEVELINQGGNANFTTSVAASWGAAAHQVQPIHSEDVDLTAAGQMQTIQLSVPLPANYKPGERRDLYITVNPGAILPDSDSENDTMFKSLGGLTIPENIRVMSSKKTSLVQVNWDEVNDPLVTGYTVYRLNPDGKKLLLGRSSTNGFLDARSVPGRLYQYQVKSHTNSLTESKGSDWVSHLTQVTRDLIFEDDFEIPIK